MEYKLTDLKTIRNYALLIGKTTTWVYYLEKHGKITTVLIDGVKFVVIKDG